MAQPVQALADAIEAKDARKIHQKLWRSHRRMQWLPSVDGTRLHHHARAGRFAFR
jgi:hypothetical protein